MSAIKLATPSEVTISLPNSSNVVYYLVYDFPFNDYAAAAADADLPALGDSMIGFGICRSRTVVQELTPNSAIVACRFDLRGYGQWIGRKQARSRTISVPNEIDIPRFAKRDGTSGLYDYVPVKGIRGQSILVVTSWSEQTPEALQDRIDRYTGRLVTGLRSGISYPTHMFIGGECDTDGTYTRVELKFLTEGSVSAVTPGGDPWTTDIQNIPALKPFERWAIRKKAATSSGPPDIYVVNPQQVFGTSIAYTTILGGFG